MKIVLIIISLFLLNPSLNWENDLDIAFQKSKEQDKSILLNFSGSDWCIPCQKLKKGLFSNDKFATYASENLILVNLDFPIKNKKEEKEYTVKKDYWSEKYNSNGHFPLTILIDKNGKVLKKWTGNIIDSPENFIDQIRSTN
jgi:thioredoxin-related protein